MTTSAVTTATPAKATTKSADAAKKLNQNYEMFLQLLTTQLKNQNPLEPMDAEKFTSQLVQYSGIEQQIEMNSQLEEMKNIIASNNAANLIGYVGKSVTAEGTQTQLANGQAQWSLSVPEAMPGASIVIRNAEGAEVFREIRALGANTSQYQWDGRTTSGTPAPAGMYQISVSGNNADGRAVAVKTQVTGTVSEVDMSGATPILRIGTMRVPLTSIQSVRG
jgi:flagellar basal-body rod modification protein FlgD